MNTIFGCDVEYFSRKERSKLKKEIIKSEGRIGPDGLAIEFRPNPGKPGELLSNIESLKDGFKLQQVLSQCLKKDDPREWRRIGCEEEYILENGEIVVNEVNKDTNLRFAGGHLHIGVPNLITADGKTFFDYAWKKVNPPKDVKMFFGEEGRLRVLNELESKIHKFLFRNEDTEKRIEIGGYGKPTSHRLKSYGIEWRAPSMLDWEKKTIMKVMEEIEKGLPKWLS